MGNIRTFKRSTPTLVYNIEGAGAAGINLDQMAIGITIVIGSITMIITASPSTSDIFDIEESDTIIVVRANNYSSHTQETNSFSITLPLWMLPLDIEESGEYQVFIYQLDGMTQYTSKGYTQVNGEPVFLGDSRAQIRPTNIVIDTGSITLFDSLVPNLAGGPATRPEGAPGGDDDEPSQPKDRSQVVFV